MVNEVAINWNGALVYALALFLPEGAWPPPQSEIDAGAGGDAGVAAMRGPDVDAWPDRCVSAASPTRRGGCSCASSPGTTPAPGSWIAWALLGLLVTRARRSRR